MKCQVALGSRDIRGQDISSIDNRHSQNSIRLVRAPECPFRTSLHSNTREMSKGVEARTSEIPMDLGMYFLNTINTTVVKNVETLGRQHCQCSFLDKSDTIMKPLINLGLKTFNIPAQKIAGRLKCHLENWSKLISDQVILKNIQGIDINF